MHAEAYAGFQKMLVMTGLDPTGEWRGLDVGGRNVNGSVRAQLPNTKWCGLDIRQGPDVDIVADAATWVPDQLFDIVICTELFEHAEQWRAIIETMSRALDPDGPMLFISTCASTNRGPHGASGEGVVPADEWYGNVDPGDLEYTLRNYFADVHVEYLYPPGDAYAYAYNVSDWRERMYSGILR